MRKVMSSVLALLFLASCANDKPAGGITVFAATSLTAAFTDIGKAFETTHPGTKVTFNFAASSALAQQLQRGAPADAIATADEATIGKLFESHLLRTPKLLARNRLVIVTKPGNPQKISTLGDLASAGTVALCAATVPCGAYAAQALHNAGVTIDESHVTRSLNVAAALTAVTDGDAVGAIVYVTDAQAAGTRVSTVTIPDEWNVIAEYPIARLKDATNASVAQAFVDFVFGAKGQAILRRYGFLA